MGLWQDPTTGKWKYSFQSQGKTYGGGGYATKAEARSAREDRRKLIAAGETAPPQGETTKTPMVFLHLADLYMQMSKRKHSPKAYNHKRMVFSRFLRYCGNEGITIDKITPLLVQKFLHTRPSNCNYNAHRRELSALFEYARKSLGIIPNNPVSALERMPEERGEKKIPTQEEFIKLVNAAQGHERHLILVLAYTAARIDEVYRMKWEDVNFEQGWIRLWTRKTNDGTYRDRKIPMRDYMKGLMRHLWETRTQDQYVFPSPKTGGKWIRSEMMKKICNRAGIPHYGFHCIRHFVASMLLDREKVGTPTVSKLLGHTNLLTTDIYAHSIGVHLQDDALGSAMDRLEATFTPKFLPATSSGLSDN